LAVGLRQPRHPGQQRLDQGEHRRSYERRMKNEELG
jgi:hypothetical protein